MAGNHAKMENRGFGSIFVQTVSTIGAALGNLNVGLAIGWCSSALVQLEAGKPTDIGTITDQECDWIGALLSVGALLQLPVTGVASERLGRKLCLLGNSIPAASGWIMTSFATNLWMLYIARILIGVSVGAYCILIPTYVAEISEPKIRGILGAMIQLFVITGVVLMYSTGMVLNWYQLSYIGVGLSVLSAAVSLILPESPVWLARHGKQEEAFQRLRWLRGSSDSHDLEQEMLNSSESRTFSGNGRLYQDPTVIKPVILITLVMVFNQLCGINVILTYADEIFKDAGAPFSSELSSLIVGIVMWVATATSVPVIKVVDRRPLLIFSLVWMSVSMCMFGMYFYLTPGPSYTWVPILCMTVFILAFCFGQGPLAWIILADLAIPQAAAAVGTAANLVNWGFSFGITLGFVDMKELLTTAGTFWFYGLSCVVGALVISIFLPETRGKSSKQIENMFL